MRRLLIATALFLLAYATPSAQIAPIVIQGPANGQAVPAQQYGALLQTLMGSSGTYSNLSVQPLSGLYVQVVPTGGEGQGSVYQPYQNAHGVRTQPASPIGPVPVPSSGSLMSVVECYTQNGDFDCLIGSNTSTNGTYPIADSNTVAIGYVTTTPSTTSIATSMISLAASFAGLNQQEFNVVNYGAKGVGSDDTSAIQSAASAAAAAGGGQVYFPCYGRYGIGNGGVSLTSGANVQFVGCGSSSALVMLSTLTAPAIQVSNTNNVTFRNFEVQGLTSNTTSNVAQPALVTAASAVTRFENLTFYYVNGPVIKMAAVGQNYSFINYIENIEARQCTGGIVGDNSGANGQSLSLFGTNILMDTISGNGDAFLFRQAHDIYLTNVADSYAPNITGNAIHLVGDTGPVMIFGYDGGGGTNSYALLSESNASGSPQRVMVSNSIFEFSPRGVSLTAGQQYGFNNDTFEYISGIGSTDSALSIASGVLDVRLQGNTWNNNSGGSSTFYDIANASTSPVLVSGNTFLDAGFAALVNNVAGNQMILNGNYFNGVNAVSSGTKPFQIINNVSASGVPTQDQYFDGKGDSTQTGYMSTTVNSVTPPPNIGGAAIGWNQTGSGDISLYDQFYNSNTAAPIVSFNAPNAGSTFMPYGEVMRNGGYFDNADQRYALELSSGTSNPVHPGEIMTTATYSSATTTFTFPGSFAFASTQYNCVVTGSGGAAVSLSYSIVSATQISVTSSAASGSLTYDCKGAT